MSIEHDYKHWVTLSKLIIKNYVRRLLAEISCDIISGLQKTLLTRKWCLIETQVISK